MGRIAVKARRVVRRPQIGFNADGSASILGYGFVNTCMPAGICPIQCIKVSYSFTITIPYSCPVVSGESETSVSHHNTWTISGAFTSLPNGIDQPAGGAPFNGTEIDFRCLTFNIDSGCYNSAGAAFTGCVKIFLGLSVTTVNSASGKYFVTAQPSFGSSFFGYVDIGSETDPGGDGAVAPITAYFNNPTAPQTLTIGATNGSVAIAAGASVDTVATITGSLTVTGSLSQCCQGITPVTTECTGEAGICGNSSSSSSSTGTPCQNSCTLLGTSGSYTATNTGTLFAMVNDTIGRFTDNGGAYTLIWDGVPYTVNGTDSIGVALPVIAGTTYTYTATGSVTNGAGYTSTPDGYGTISVIQTTGCITAPYMALVGFFICETVGGGSSSSGSTTPPDCEVPVGTTGASSEMVDVDVYYAVSDGTTLTYYATSIGGGGNHITNDCTGGPNAAGDSSFGENNGAPETANGFGVADGIGPISGFTEVGSLVCPGGTECVWTVTPIGGGTNPSAIKGSGPVTGSYASSFFYNGATSLYDIPVTAASVKANGAAIGSLWVCVVFRNVVVS
jgi:hypothetical protein